MVGLLWCEGLHQTVLVQLFALLAQPTFGPTHLSPFPEQRVEGQGTPRLLMAFSRIVFLPAPYISAQKTGNATECSTLFQSGGEKRGGNIRIKQPVISSSTARGELTKPSFFFFYLETVTAGPPWKLCEDETTQPGYPAHCFTHCLTYVNPVCLGGGGN